MKLKYLLIAIATISVASCSTAYRSGQTPDDVYYSPVRVIEENTRYERNDRNNDVVRYDDYEEREIRMSMRDHRWRDINDYYGYNYRYNPYSYGYNYGYYYNPYYYSRPVYLPGYAILNPKTSTPRTTNLSSYNNNNTVVVSDGKTGQTRWIQPSRTYNNSNKSSGNNSGGFVRRVLTPAIQNSNSSNNNSNSNNSSSNNSRTYNPAPSTSSSNSGSSSSGSSSGTVTRPARGNN